MDCAQRSALVLTVLAVISAGCLGEPIPRRVVAGTSVTVGYDGGVFGVLPADAVGNLVRPDPQRGNVRFSLCPVTGDTCSPEVRLPVRYISRIFPDRGSRLGLTGAVEFRPIGASGDPISQPGFLNGEPFAVLDIPLGTMPRTYRLGTFVSRPGFSETLSFLGPIEVVFGDVAMFSNLEILLNAPGTEASMSLQGFVPPPQLSLELLDTGTPADVPAAGSVTLRYPSTVKIEGAFEGGVLGQGSLVRMFTGPDPGPNEDSVVLVFVDIDKKTFKLNVPFTLVNPAGPAVPISAFTITEQTLYALDGSVIPSTGDVSAPGNRFNVSGIN